MSFELVMGKRWFADGDERARKGTGLGRVSGLCARLPCGVRIHRAAEILSGDEAPDAHAGTRL